MSLDAGRSKTVSFWCRGPDDNIGDVVLRRSYLRTLQEMGRCHVFVGAATESFVNGLRLRDIDRVYRSKFAFWLHLARNAPSPRWVFAFNPGELRLGPAQALNYLLLAPLLLVARVRGASILALGIGLEPRSGAWHMLIRAVIRVATLISWRDARSRRIMGHGLIQPDWAFDDRAESPTVQSPTDRSILAVTMRGDRPVPSQAWCDGVIRAAQSQGLRIVTFTQVGRDGHVSRELARRLGGECLAWGPGTDHVSQERAVRRLLSESAVVLTDRLHAAVMGLVEGALPVCVIEYDSDKLARHFAVMKLDIGHRTSGASASKIVQGEIVKATMAADFMQNRLVAAKRELEVVRRAMLS